MSTVSSHSLGRPMSDHELASFHGAGGCTVNITIHPNGTATVEYEGNCKGVKVE